MQQKIDGLLVPKLRFPEFWDAGEWKERTLAEFLTESRILGSRGDVAKKITVKLWGKGVYKKNDEIKGSINTQYYRRKAGQFIYSKLDFLNQAFGIISKNLDSYESTVDLPCFDINERLNSIFLLEYVKRKEFYERLGEAADGSRKARRIHADTFLSFSIFVPSIKEQKKIADCLSSISDRITLEAQKLDTLKTHKKGLMQQLFPAEGETLPKLRFPEFQDDWKIAKIGDFIESYKGGSPLTPSDFIPYSDYEVIPKKAINDGMWLKIDTDAQTYCKEKFYKENLQSVVDSTYLITTLRDLVPSGPSIGYIVKYATNKSYILAQGVYGLKPKKTIIPDFLIHFSKTGKYRKMMQSLMVGSTQVHIRNSVYLDVPFNVPTLEEQQKIADCLSSLDELIAAQTQAIDTLKTHKKGIMQQLFPSVEEVKA